MIGNKNKIVLLFSGDFAPIIPIDEISKNHFEPIKEILDASDLHITNLECPLTLSEDKIEKSGPAIKAHPETIKLLMQARVSIACIANNHIFDYGEKGISDTIAECKRNNIETAGIVNRPDKQDHWLIKEVRGKKIGFLNYCEHEFSVRGKGLLGACGYDPINAYYDIAHLRSDVDYLIVVYHGGNEYYNLPRPGLKKDFHFLADLGADAVIGHHTHVISGYEIYKGKPLVYSLGNFFFPFNGEPESWHEGIICQLKIDDAIDIEFTPILQCKDRLEVIKLSKEKDDIILNRIEILAGIISDDKVLQNAWDKYVRSFGTSLTRKVLFPTLLDKVFSKTPIFKNYVYDKKKRKSIINILGCRSLEQLLIDNLNSR